MIDHRVNWNNDKETPSESDFFGANFALKLSKSLSNLRSMNADSHFFGGMRKDQAKQHF